MPGPRRSHSLVLAWIAFIDRQGFLPVLPVPIFELDRNRGADRLALANSRQNMRGVALNFHAAAAAVSLLTAPQVAIHEGLVHFQAGRQARKESDQRLAMRLPGGEVTEHKRSILPE